MSDLLGLTSVLFVALVVFLCAFRWPEASRILWVAFLIRTTLAVAHYYGLELPDSGSDARSYEKNAWDLAQQGLFETVGAFRLSGSAFISWVIAIPYALFDRSLLMAQSISVLMGVSTVLVGWRIACELGGIEAGRRAGWVLALFPSLVLYSALPMREPYITLLLALAVLNAISWFRTRRIRYFFLTVSWFSSAVFFHGGMAVGLVIYLIVVLIQSGWDLIRGREKTLKSLVLCCLIVGPGSVYLISDFDIPKLGTLAEMFNEERLVETIRIRSEGAPDGGVGAEYPSWMIPDDMVGLILQIPVRAAYFLFAPFPWDLQKPIHFFGLLDALAYWMALLLAWRVRGDLWSDRVLFPIWLIFFAYVVVFSIGTGNFGSGLRHRSKFVLIPVVLLASYLGGDRRTNPKRTSKIK